MYERLNLPPAEQKLSKLHNWSRWVWKAAVLTGAAFFVREAIIGFNEPTTKAPVLRSTINISGYGANSPNKVDIAALDDGYDYWCHDNHCGGSAPMNSADPSVSYSIIDAGSLQIQEY